MSVNSIINQVEEFCSERNKTFEECLALMGSIISEFNGCFLRKKADELWDFEYEIRMKCMEDNDSRILRDALLKINNLIWKTSPGEKSFEQYSKVMSKIVDDGWDNIAYFLSQEKEKAMKSKNSEEATKYNNIVENFIYKNLDNKIFSRDISNHFRVVNLIDIETFEDYTPDTRLKKLYAIFVSREFNKKQNIQYGSIDHIGFIKILNKNKDKKICLEAMYGDIMSSKTWAAMDMMLNSIENSCDEMDFDFSTIDENELESNDKIKDFYLGFRKIYPDIVNNDFYISSGTFTTTDSAHEQYFMYLGSYIVPLFSEKIKSNEKMNFDALYGILSKRIDFLLNNHYGESKIEITQQQKDKLIVQTLIYGVDSFNLSQLFSDEQIYKIFSMLAGAEKFTDGYKFNLNDIEDLINLAKKSTLSISQVFRFCKAHIDKNVKPADILALMDKLKIKFEDVERGSKEHVTLEEKRRERYGWRNPNDIVERYALFNMNDLENHIANIPQDQKDQKETDKWFSFFENTRSIFPRLLCSEEKKSARKLFVKTIKALPQNYLSYEKFRSLLDYFMRGYSSRNAISLTSDELKILDSKINKEQENIPEGYASVSRLKEMYFKIDDQIEESDEANNKNEIIDINKIESYQFSENVFKIQNAQFKPEIQVESEIDEKEKGKKSGNYDIEKISVDTIDCIDKNITSDDSVNANNIIGNEIDCKKNTRINDYETDKNNFVDINCINKNSSDVNNIIESESTFMNINKIKSEDVSKIQNVPFKSEVQIESKIGEKEKNTKLDNCNVNEENNNVDTYRGNESINNHGIDINKIEYKNLSENESKQYNKENQIRFDIEKEKGEFKKWVSNKLKNNLLWHLIIWAFELWFNHKLETKLQKLSKKEHLEPAPNVNDNQNQNKGEDRVPNMQPTMFQITIRRIN